MGATMGAMVHGLQGLWTEEPTEEERHATRQKLYKRMKWAGLNVSILHDAEDEELLIILLSAAPARLEVLPPS